MLFRKAEESINSWIHHSSTALLVTGARQVGKTFLIRNCLKSCACDFLEINLIEHPEYVPALRESKTSQDLVINLSAATGYHFTEGKSIIFIDEVQELKEVLTQIKFWVDEGRFRFILSGSLLGVELYNLRSAPVGYLNELKMYPMDFEEFVLACGVQPETIDYLRDCFDTKTEIKDLVHQTFMKHFSRYLVVGGMPACVQEFIQSGDVNRVSQIQKSILNFYKVDFTKYEALDKRLMITSIFNSVPSQLMSQNRRFNFSDLKKGLRFERIENSFLWLVHAGVVIPTYNVTEPRVALAQNEKSSLFKLYSSDVGLLTSQYGNAIRLSLLTGDQRVNLGGIFENAVAQELLCHGFQTFFYNSKKQGELDFILELNGNVVPIEVKSGKDYYIHSAISNVLQNPEYNIPEAFVFANCNIHIDHKITYIPIYLSGFIRDRFTLPVLPPL